MAKARSPIYKTLDFKSIVDQLEPDRLTKPELIYPFRKPKFQQPDQPGETYRWVREEDLDV